MGWRGNRDKIKNGVRVLRLATVRGAVLTTLITFNVIGKGKGLTADSGAHTRGTRRLLYDFEVLPT